MPSPASTVTLRTNVWTVLYQAIAWTSLAAAAADEPFRFPEAKHGKGELRYIDGIPVLTLAGTPEEIGEQMGTLTKPALEPLAKKLDDFIDAWRVRPIWPLVTKTAGFAAARFPRDSLREIDALARASGVDRGLIIAGHVMPDMLRLRGCTDIVIEPAKSATGQLLFGRNTDVPPFGRLSEYGLLVVYRPNGKHAFASLSFPGMVGASAAMNDAGLCIGLNEILATADKSPAYDPAGSPLILNARRLLEECQDLGEADKLIRTMKWDAATLICAADRKQGSVFEITPRNVQVRKASAGFCGATNHFRTEGLAVDQRCWRFDRLLELQGQMELPGQKRIAIAELNRMLDAVNQGNMTIQTGIFEPSDLRAHIALGSGPATKLRRSQLNLAELFRVK